MQTYSLLKMSTPNQQESFIIIIIISAVQFVSVVPIFFNRLQLIDFRSEIIEA